MRGTEQLVLFVAILIVLVIAVRAWQRGQVAQQDQQQEASGQTFIRTYRGSARETAEDFGRDAALLARKGYVPTSQIYTPGSYGCGAFLLALILFVVLIGLLIFIYMLIVKPAGTLVVTYEHRPPVPSGPVATEAAPPASGPAVALAALAQMRDQGHISPEEYESKKAEILGRL